MKFFFGQESYQDDKFYLACVKYIEYIYDEQDEQDFTKIVQQTREVLTHALYDHLETIPLTKKELEKESQYQKDYDY